MLSLTRLEASPPHTSHTILADRCDAFQKAGCSDRYLRCARCALLSSVLPAVQSCYGCYSLGGLLQGSGHKDNLTSSVLVHLRECTYVCALVHWKTRQRVKDKCSKAMFVFAPYQLYPQVSMPSSYTVFFLLPEHKPDAPTVKKTCFRETECRFRMIHKMALTSGVIYMQVVWFTVCLLPRALIGRLTTYHHALWEQKQSVVKVVLLSGFCWPWRGSHVNVPLNISRSSQSKCGRLLSVSVGITWLIDSTSHDAKAGRAVQHQHCCRSGPEQSFSHRPLVTL